MARPIVLSNGRLLVGLNDKGLVHDFYFPFVGQSNMTNSRQVEHKIGIYIDGTFSWIDDSSWSIDYRIEPSALVGYTSYTNKDLGIEININSFVDSYDDAFCRKIDVVNKGDKSLSLRLFLHQAFQISANGRADTAMYIPSKQPYILNYRGNTAIAISAKTSSGDFFDQYAVGMYDSASDQGTYKDAEDGSLSNNPVEHGSVDSAVSVRLEIKPGFKESVDYWVALSSRDYHHATRLHRSIARDGIEVLLRRTQQYWINWLATSENNLKGFSKEELSRVKLSLMIIKAHIDERGGVLASSDSEIFNYGKDYYSYVWPRDAAHSLTPLIRLGYTSEAMQYFRYIQSVMHPKGYVHHKYQLDGGLGSTWHPMIQNGKPELNIQEDETASTVLLFYELAKVCPDKDFLSDIYENVIVRMLNFMAGYVNESTGLPYPSYDLWEEKFLTTTYTTLIVAKALDKGATEAFSSVYDNKDVWSTASRVIRSNIAKLYSAEDQYFVKGITPEIAGAYEKDRVLDISSLYALFKYGDYNSGHLAIISTSKAVENLILNKSPSGGVVRYENDVYMLSKPYTGNPWHVCTLWLAQYYIWSGRHKDVEELINWTFKHCLKTGVMSEQLDPDSGEEIGVAPLVWSHAELINTLLDKNSVPN